MAKSYQFNKNDKATISAKISIMLENGRKEIISKEELEKFPIGSLISYTNVNNTFKIGGFITKFSYDHFVYIDTSFSQKFRVRYKNILKMFAGCVFSTKNDFVSLVPAHQKVSNFPVVIGNVTVYYAKNNFDKKRYLHTQKVMTSMHWCNYFLNNSS
ncbi:MAG: hypothetical protein Satyrvirus11_14 [Satyrvirus sp.]|uniref:Uncharacterized protein n=1 Tax=Satyrvirus sp. TaxID=2487771 RepID=A0A3G5ADS7_9VIRU|nr:MAG: hypothetical protein Satyrvirus11_14 [Satyrvirus sp.]